MSLSQVHYLPLAPPFFFILVGLFVALLVLIQLGVLRYAYMRLGISSGAALLLLFASLVGSYFNIPVAYLPEHRVLAQQEIDFFGMRYVVPVVAQWPGTVIMQLTPPSSMATRSSCRPIATPIAGHLVGSASPRSSAARERAWQSGSQLACHRHRRSPAGTTRQSGRLLPRRPGWQGKTDSHAAGDRLVPRRAIGGDVNDPN